MRVVLDTNVLLSAVASGASGTGLVLKHWDAGSFTLLSCEEQIAEIRRASRYARLSGRLVPSRVGKLVGDLRDIAQIVHDLPSVDASRDPFDNYLLALAQIGRADFLVSGDKAGLLALERFGQTRIIAVRPFLERL